MKKWMLALLLLVAVALVILLIPRSGNIHVSASFNVNTIAFSRSFSEEKSWTRWWPGSSTLNSQGLPVFQYNDASYTVNDKTTNSFIITITRDNKSLKTILNFTGTSDSIMLSWVGRLPSSNLIGQWNSSRKKKAFEKDMKFILDRITGFYSSERNIYGIDIREEKVMDSILISSQQLFTYPPAPGDIYKMIDELKAYAKQQQASETNYPMVNVFTHDSVKFLTKVAIPVNRRLPGNKHIFYKWMLGGGNILVTEVKGGPVTIKSALKEVENYVNDYKRISPAIPYESLVTDRRQEKDTGKWITKLYYPVM